MKRKLADVLWEAANRWLHPYKSYGWANANKEGLCTYSCHAVDAALKGCAPLESHEVPDAVHYFLSSLGCDGSAAAGKVLHYDQGSRYMWLLLAMHVAADEKIMVEVAS